MRKFRVLLLIGVIAICIFFLYQFFKPYLFLIGIDKNIESYYPEGIIDGDIKVHETKIIDSEILVLYSYDDLVLKKQIYALAVYTSGDVTHKKRYSCYGNVASEADYGSAAYINDKNRTIFIMYGYNNNKAYKEVELQISSKDIYYVADISDKEYYLLTYQSGNVFNIDNSGNSKTFWVSGYDTSYESGPLFNMKFR